MSHSPKAPPLATTTADLPEVEDGVLAYDTTQGKPVARVAGAWENIAGGEVIGTPTVVYDDGAAVGNTDQIQGDIPDDWKRADTSLTGLVIGTSCTSIGYDAFGFCTGLTGSLVIPDSVTTIVEGAFRDCTGLTGDLVIPNSVTSIESLAFDSCSGFNGTLTIGNSVTVIGNLSFRSCSNLTGELVIPDSVTNIGSAAFNQCIGLTSVTIGSNVTNMGGFVGAFENCTGLLVVNCYVEKSILDSSGNLSGTAVTTIHVRSTDSTWTAGAGQTIGGKTGIEVIKDL